MSRIQLRNLDVVNEEVVMEEIKKIFGGEGEDKGWNNMSSGTVMMYDNHIKGGYEVEYRYESRPVEIQTTITIKTNKQIKRYRGRALQSEWQYWD